jgi:glutathione S-transferase
MSNLALYGHPFSSYTWKALIALYANDTPFEFRIVDADHPDHCAIVASASPQGKFPVLADGDRLIFESTSIIEYLQAHYPGPVPLLPKDQDAAIRVRMLDRVFDHYVMNIMQPVVEEYIRAPHSPDQARIAEIKARLLRSYAWIEGWLADYAANSTAITLIECAAAPSLFYADWIEPIPTDCPRLSRWRSHLLALPAVSRCVEDARPFRGWFPPGAPDRD